MYWGLYSGTSERDGRETFLTPDLCRTTDTTKAMIFSDISEANKGKDRAEYLIKQLTGTSSQLESRQLF